MPYFDNVEKFSREYPQINKLPVAETAKLAILRPTTHFRIETNDNPDMARTLEEQANYVAMHLVDPKNTLTEVELKEAFQIELSNRAHQEQNGLIRAMKDHGVQIAEMIEDKVNLEGSGHSYYTDQIFATDVGQYYDNNGKLCFIPARFKNRQRQGEERLAEAQAGNLYANIQELRDENNERLTFEGGDIRQMPGRKLFLIGQGHRSDARTSMKIADVSGYIVLPIKLLQAQFYHLDCCFLPLPNDAAVIYEGEYERDANQQLIMDTNGWPKLVAGTETMTQESRELIRHLYPANKLITISKAEALAFATNSAILVSHTDNRFKMFVNGVRANVTNEVDALQKHQISYTQANYNKLLEVTGGMMDVVEVPYSTMHGSGGSVRCTIQEVACRRDIFDLAKQQISPRTLEVESSPTQIRLGLFRPCKSASNMSDVEKLAELPFLRAVKK